MAASVFFSSSSELATLSNTFRVGTTPTDPTSVTLTVTSPTNAETQPALTHSATGTYTVDITCDEDGTWQYLWESTGAATDAEAGTWAVRPIDLRRLYCTVEAVKSRLAITSTNYDDELHEACFAVSRWIEEYCDRVFWRTTSTARTFEADNGYCLELPAFSDLVSITTLKTDTGADGTFATTWTTDDYQLLPYNVDAAAELLPYNEIKAIGSKTFPIAYGLGRRNLVQVTGVFGWPKVPYGIRQGALILAADTFKLKDAPFGIEGSADFTTNVGDNRRAMRFIDPYRREAVKVA